MDVYFEVLFKQRDDVFRIIFQKVSLVPLWKTTGMQVTLEFGRTL